MAHLVPTRVAREDLPEAVLAVVRAARLVWTEAELGVAEARRRGVRARLLLPAGVLLRHVHARLQHGRHPARRVVTVRAPEVRPARAHAQLLHAVAVEGGGVAAAAGQDAVVPLAPRPAQLLLADGAGGGRGGAPPSSRPAAVSAAQTLELAKELHEAVVASAAVQMVTLLAGSLCTTHRGSFLLAENTFKSGTAPKLAPDVGGQEAADAIAVLSALAEAGAEQEAEVVGRDVLQAVEEVTRQDGGVALAEVTDSFTQDNGSHSEYPGLDNVGQISFLLVIDYDVMDHKYLNSFQRRAFAKSLKFHCHSLNNVGRSCRSCDGVNSLDSLYKMCMFVS